MYSIQAKANNSAEILLYGSIGDDVFAESTTAKQFLDELNQITASEIVLRINSVGGSVPDGLAIYNALKRQDVPVKMVIYPRQDHRIDEPRLRLDMRKRPVAWFERWLLESG